MSWGETRRRFEWTGFGSAETPPRDWTVAAVVLSMVIGSDGGMEEGLPRRTSRLGSMTWRSLNARGPQ